jgi:hypothetical protein
MNFPAWGRFFLLVLLMSGLSGRARANEQNTRETWSVVVLQEKKCGFDHTTVVRREADHGSEFTTSEHQEFRFKRMGHELRIVCGSAITEDEQGVVLKFSSFTQGAGTNNKLVGYREGEEMVLRNNGKKSPYAMPRSALGPAAVDRLTRALPRKRGATVETDVFMPESPQAPAHISIRSAGRKLVEIEEQTMELWKVVTQNSTLPGVDTIDYIDERGDSHLSLIPFPGIGELRLLRTTPEAAKAKLEAAELFLPSLIFPDKPLPQPRDLI